MGNWDSLHSIIWFLPTLFSLNLLFFFFNKYNIKIQYLILIISILTFLFADKITKLHYSIAFGIDVALYIFILSYFIKYIYVNKEKFIINKNYLTMIIIASSLMVFSFEPIKIHTQYHAIIDLAQFSVAITLIGYTSFLILNISIFILFLNIKPNKILSVVGSYSLPIFLLHLMVLYKLPNLVQFENTILNIIWLILAFLLAISLPIIVSKVTMKISNKFKYIGMIQ